jgi:hypothetical protein
MMINPPGWPVWAGPAKLQEINLTPHDITPERARVLLKEQFDNVLIAQFFHDDGSAAWYVSCRLGTANSYGNAIALHNAIDKAIIDMNDRVSMPGPDMEERYPEPGEHPEDWRKMSDGKTEIMHQKPGESGSDLAMRALGIKGAK